MMRRIHELKLKLLTRKIAVERAIRMGLQSDLRRQLHEIPTGMSFPADRHQLGIVVIVKDEEDYLEEWLEFHFLVGVDHVVIYDNGSTDGSRALLQDDVERGVVTVVDWQNFSSALKPQKAAYAHAIANYGPRFRWLAFIDVDEFLFPTEGSSLKKTLQTLDAQPCVSVPWSNFGPDGHITKPAGLVIENYRERMKDPPEPGQYTLLRYKTIVDPAEVTAVGAHVFGIRNYGPVIFNETGAHVPDTQQWNLAHMKREKLCLNHYFTRSMEEMEDKIAKGRVSSGGQDRGKRDFARKRLAKYQRATQRDDTIQRFVPQLRQRLSRRAMRRATVHLKTAAG